MLTLKKYIFKLGVYFLMYPQREDFGLKKRLNSGIARKWGRGLPLTDFFAPFFYLSKSILNGREAGGGWVIPEFKLFLTEVLSETPPRFGQRPNFFRFFLLPSLRWKLTFVFFSHSPYDYFRDAASKKREKVGKIPMSRDPPHNTPQPPSLREFFRQNIVFCRKLFYL